MPISERDVSKLRDDAKARKSLLDVLEALMGLSDELVDRVLKAACEFYEIER